ncbi:hypothetical protein [Paenibacillus sp. Soil750]|uniref:hypothetical protein n=1 Tax=Paenibacillus sp. Soil750 TaxID=1736398 RepID=UPI0012FB5FE9|nr:hypothetical protein [Paenibacillus sp. Soil750]
MTKQQILQLEKNKDAECLARFGDLERAKSYYAKQNGIYTAYIENIENLKNGFATPVKVYKMNRLPN